MFFEGKVTPTVTRGAESWQFFAFVFAAFAAIGLALADDLVKCAGWRVATKLSWFAFTFYLFMLNGWVRNELIRFLGWLKVEHH
jgi:hypothetical protein